MNSKVIDCCNFLIKNREILRTGFHWEDSSMMLAGSSFYVGLGVEADIEKLKECERILKENTGVFSDFRSNIKLPVLCKMVLKPNPLQYLNDLKDMVTQLKHLRWANNEYKILASVILLDHVQHNEIPVAIKKLTYLYECMKKDHPFLTTDEDIPFAALLAASTAEPDNLLEEMEACFNILKDTFHDKNAVQSLSHIMAIHPDSPVNKCVRVNEVFFKLKDRKHRFGTGIELALLGTLTSLDIPDDDIVDEIIEADNFLKTQKGFGDFSMGDKTRRMYAALMVMDAHIPPAALSHETMVNSMLSIVIMMEICMMLIMTTVIVNTTVTP